MKPKRLYAIVSVAAFLALHLLSGCATTESQHDGTSARALIDSMRSPIHSFPANVPR